MAVKRRKVLHEWTVIPFRYGSACWLRHEIRNAGRYRDTQSELLPAGWQVLGGRWRVRQKVYELR